MFSRPLIVLYVFLVLAHSGCHTTSVSTTQSVQQGDVLSNESDFGEAIEIYENFLTENTSLGIYRNYERESEVCRKLAYAYSAQSEHKKSLEYLQKAHDLDKNHNKNNYRHHDDRYANHESLLPRFHCAPREIHVQL